LQKSPVFVIATAPENRIMVPMPAPDNQHDIDIAKVTQRAKDIEDKLPKLRQWMEQGQVILSMVKDYWAGNYREVPYWAISAGALSLLYVLNPADVIPDMILGVGYLDDATVVAFCLKLIERELVKYKEWQAARKPSPPAKAGKVIDV
jgi:uncharacterized membrane protein YkvA (DUF1232 family)